MGTAANAYGFDTEETAEIHMLNPMRHQIRSTSGLVVHRRRGAPLLTVADRPATAPAWTAVELARVLPRPRSLATLDAALRSGHCNTADLASTVTAQSGRRGIVKVRRLLPLADGRAESPMESEARLVMIGGGLPVPALQYEIVDGLGRLRRFDFAWPDAMLAAEYDSAIWHGSAVAEGQGETGRGSRYRLDRRTDRRRRRAPAPPPASQSDRRTPSPRRKYPARVRIGHALTACRRSDTHARGDEAARPAPTCTSVPPRVRIVHALTACPRTDTHARAKKGLGGVGRE